MLSTCTFNYRELTCKIVPLLQLMVDRNKREFICESCNELGCLNQTFVLKNTTKLRRPHIGLWRLDSDAVEFYVTYQKDTKYYLFEYFYQLYDDQWKKSLHKNFTVGLYKTNVYFSILDFVWNKNIRYLNILFSFIRN